MKDLLRKFLIIALVLAFPALGMAAPTTTVVASEPSVGLFKTVITWDAGAGASTVTSATFNVAEPCYFISGWTNPATATAPTADYDIGITNSDGADYFGLALNDRHTTASEIAVPVSPGAGLAVGAVTFALTNNSVNDADGTVTLYCVTGD